MSSRGLYTVRLAGLGDGEHEFSFELDHRFFASFENPIVESGSVNAKVTLEKNQGLLALHFNLHGEVEVICDRCLLSFMTSVEAIQDIFVKTGDFSGELEDNVIMINKEDHEIDVAQYLYEYVVLSLPMQKIHPDREGGESGCDPEMLNKLKEYAAQKPEKKRDPDPRWDALKGILENNN